MIKISIYSLFLLLSVGVVSSCSKDTTLVDGSLLKTELFSSAGGYPAMDYGIVGSLHRKYTGCKRRFSICGVRGGHTPFIGETPLGIQIDDNNDGTLDMTIYFLAEPDTLESFFIGADDDPFQFESTVASNFGYTSVTTIPDNYTFIQKDIDIVDYQDSIQTAIGFVTIKCNYTL